MKAGESWFSRAKAEADKGIARRDRVVSIAICVFCTLMMTYFALHQVRSTGFFTETFRSAEIFMLYGFWAFWITTSGLEGILGLRFLSRIVDTFGGAVFAAACIAWLLVVFPFDFTYFADVLPDSLRFLLRWISDSTAWGLMLAGIVLHVVAAIYCPIAYKFAEIKLFNRQRSSNENPEKE